MEPIILDEYNDQFTLLGKLVAFWALLKIIF